MNKELKQKVEERIGKRCKEYDAECFGCRMWEMIDRATMAERNRCVEIANTHCCGLPAYDKKDKNNCEVCENDRCQFTIAQAIQAPQRVA